LPTGAELVYVVIVVDLKEAFVVIIYLAWIKNMGYLSTEIYSVANEKIAKKKFWHPSYICLTKVILFSLFQL
jgi:hypothetical protein